jgi:hypothetical protein
MPTVLRRPILAFVLGAALVAAAAGTAAYAALNDERVAACYVPKTGALYVTGRDGAPTGCAPGHLPIDWPIRGRQGPAGVFSGTFESPNGQYSISVTDAGIVLASPDAEVRLTGANIAIESAGATTVQAGTTIGLTSGATTGIQAGTSLALASGNGTSVQAGKAVTLVAGTDLAVAVGGATTVNGTGDVTTESQRPLTLRGIQSTVVESSGPVTVKGASTTVQASGLNLLKGALVQANGTPLP